MAEEHTSYREMSREVMLKEVAITARDSERLRMIHARSASRIGQLIKLGENLQDILTKTQSSVRFMVCYQRRVA